MAARRQALVVGIAIVAVFALAGCGGASDRKGELPVSDEGLPPVVAVAVADLAGRLGLAADAVAVVEVRPVQWSDACLGVYYPDRLCAQVVTSGYRLKLRAQGKEYTYHTDTRDHVIATDFAQGATITDPLDLPLAPTPAPPQARLVTSSGEQVGGIGSYCWSEGGAGVCVDKIGLPTPKVPIAARAGERIVFRLGFEPTQVSVVAVPAERVIQEIPEGVIWQSEGQELLAQELPSRSSADFAPDLPPGRYVFSLFAAGAKGDVSYGFLVEIAGG